MVKNRNRMTTSETRKKPLYNMELRIEIEKKKPKGDDSVVISVVADVHRAGGNNNGTAECFNNMLTESDNKIDGKKTSM